MTNEKLNCIIEGQGSDITLTFHTSIYFRIGDDYLGQYGSVDCYEPAYDDKDYLFKISIVDFLDEFESYFNLESFINDDESDSDEFSFEEFSKSLTQEKVNEILNSIILTGNHSIYTFRDKLDELADIQYHKENDSI